MYLSTLLINVGTNPDRPRPGRFWLRNRYRVHQRLCMAFPSKERKDQDREFLQPVGPDPKRWSADFPNADVHTPRSTDSGFLFRIDPRPGASPVIVVLSAHHPDWAYAFQNAPEVLAAPPQVHDFAPPFQPKQLLRFRLEANPVRRASQNSTGTDGKPIDPKWVGKRIPVPNTEQAYVDWLARRAEPAWSRRKHGPNENPPGFRLDVGWLSSFVSGYVYSNKKGRRGTGHQLRSVRYEGILEVSDPESFQETLAAGIGPAKGYGFGLLSVAPV